MAGQFSFIDLYGKTQLATHDILADALYIVGQRVRQNRVPCEKWTTRGSYIDKFSVSCSSRYHHQLSRLLLMRGKIRLIDAIACAKGKVQLTWPCGPIKRSGSDHIDFWKIPQLQVPVCCVPRPPLNPQKPKQGKKRE